MDPAAAGAFRLAAARNDVRTMEVLKHAPHFDVDASENGFTPLMAAVAMGHEEATLWLLQNGASLTSLKQDGWRDSVLHYAAAKGNMAIIKMLLAFGADPFAVNSNGKSPADVAKANSHIRAASYIVSVVGGMTAPPVKADMMVPVSLTGCQTELLVTCNSASTAHHHLHRGLLEDDTGRPSPRFAPTDLEAAVAAPASIKVPMSKKQVGHGWAWQA